MTRPLVDSRLNEVRELWVWGSWKEPMPLGFSSHVFVVCTSRAAGRRYAAERNSDTWLLADEFGEEAAERPPVPGDDVLFTTSADEGFGGRSFRLLTFEQFVKELREQSRMTKARGGITLLVNPRRATEGIEADVICSGEEFLRRQSSAGT